MRHGAVGLRGGAGRLVLAGWSLLAVYSAGCGSPERPPHDLPDSVFVEVLMDVHLADARASTTGVSADSLRTEALKRHGLDTLAFRGLMDYYARHPEPYLALYDEALDRLLLEQRGPRTPSDTL